MEYCNYLSSIIIYIARRTCENKTRISMAKATFNKKNPFTSKLGFKFTEGTSKVLHMEYSFVWC